MANLDSYQEIGVTHVALIYNQQQRKYSIFRTFDSKRNADKWYHEECQAQEITEIRTLKQAEKRL